MRCVSGKQFIIFGSLWLKKTIPGRPVGLFTVQVPLASWLFSVALLKSLALITVFLNATPSWKASPYFFIIIINLRRTYIWDHWHLKKLVLSALPRLQIRDVLAKSITEQPAVVLGRNKSELLDLWVGIQDTNHSATFPSLSPPISAIPHIHFILKFIKIVRLTW